MNKCEWKEKILEPGLRCLPPSKDKFSLASGLGIEPVYKPEDSES